MTRASARRILLTFHALGDLRLEDRRFSPTLRVLDLGWAFLDSLHVEDLLKPLMEQLAAGCANRSRCTSSTAARSCTWRACTRRT